MIRPVDSALRAPLECFAISYLGMLLVAIGITGYLEIGHPGSISLTFVVLAAAAAGLRFVKREQRLPTWEEHWHLVLGSAALAVVIEVVVTFSSVLLLNSLAGGVSSIELMLRDLPIVVLIGVFLFSALVIVSMCMLGYGPMMRLSYGLLVKQGKLLPDSALG